MEVNKKPNFLIIFLDFILFFSSFQCFAASGSYLSSVQDIIKEIRPQPSFDDIESFLRASPKVDKTHSIEESAEKITEYIFKKLKIKADQSYLSRAQKDNILPDGVLTSKKGHCVGLTILFLLIGEKNGLDVGLVRAPDHVFPRICNQSKCLNIEMLRGGDIKTNDYYIKNLFISKDALAKKLYLQTLKSPLELKASIYLGLGYVANYAKQKGLAELFYTKSIENSTTFAEPYSNRAAIYVETGRLDQAKQELKKALSINPTHYASLVNLGVIENNQGHIKEALQYYDRSLKVNPLAVKAYRRRASIYESTKDNKRAILDLERILIIEPKFCDVIEAKVRLKRSYDKSYDATEDSQKLSQLVSQKSCLYLPVQ
ncbi:MAG: tetratricopeptide repeat protein [Bdellovibrionales bacterium]|nr:tetratricopeptide repeat protein [Bdellovibrionales bacterium]